MNNNDNTGYSIIIPTFRESQNVPELVARISQIKFEEPFEVIFVDDNSQDGIAEVISQLQAQYPWLKLIIRSENRSLSESVIEGCKQAQYGTFIVMDADLSHPPEKIPELIAALSIQDVDFVIGSRYQAGGSTDETWPAARKLISRVAAQISKTLLSISVQDSLSGFFAIRKAKFLEADKLNPIGWKIGLELMIKCHCKKIIEVPIRFSERQRGASKLNIKVVYNYMQHVQRLMCYKLSKN